MRVLVLLALLAAVRAQEPEPSPFDRQWAQLVGNESAAERAKAARALAAQGEAVLAPLLARTAQAMDIVDAAPVYFAMGEEAAPFLMREAAAAGTPAGVCAACALLVLPKRTATRFGLVVRALASARTRMLVTMSLAAYGWRWRAAAGDADKATKEELTARIVAMLRKGTTYEQSTAIRVVTALGPGAFTRFGVVKKPILDWAMTDKVHPDLHYGARWAVQSFRKSYLGLPRHQAGLPPPVKNLRRDRHAWAAVQRGLTLLAKRQESWRDWTVNPTYGVGLTAMCVSAFLRAGYADPLDEKENPHAKVVRAALEWLLAQQSESARGRFGPAHQNTVYNHALAVLALSEAFQVTGDPIYYRPLLLGVIYATRTRTPDGGWGYDTKEANTSATVHVVAALKRAWYAGFPVLGESFAGALKGVDGVTNGTGSVDYSEGRPGSVRYEEQLKVYPYKNFPIDRTAAMTAAGIYVRLLAGEDPRHTAAIRKGAKLCLALPPTKEWGEVDAYYWWLASEALAWVGGATEKTWRKALVATVVAEQQEDGSWRGGPWSFYGGDTFSTAAIVLALEAAYH